MSNDKILVGKNNRQISHICFIVLLTSILLSFNSFATPGTHGNTISTFDTTRSSVVMSYNHGFLLEGGYFNQAGYNANFTSSTGKLSAQFGLQFLNLRSHTVNWKRNHHQVSF